MPAAIACACIRRARGPRRDAPAIPRGNGSCEPSHCGFPRAPWPCGASPRPWSLLAGGGLHAFPGGVGNAIAGMAAAELVQRLVGFGMAGFGAKARDALELPDRIGVRLGAEGGLRF